MAAPLSNCSWYTVLLFAPSFLHSLIPHTLVPRATKQLSSPFGPFAVHFRTAMKLLTRYVLFELLKVFAVSLVGMTLFMILFGVMREAISQGLGAKQIALLVPYFVPEALRFAVPGTILFAACSVYGRLAAFNEIVAVKSMGISPLVLFWPTFVLATLLSLATVWLNDVAVSWGRNGMRRVVIESVEEIAYGKLAQQKSFATKNFAINVKSVEGHRLIQPTLTFQANLDSPAYTITAAEAELRADPAANTLTIICRDAEYEMGAIKGRFPDTIERVVSLSESTKKGGNSGSTSDVPLSEISADIDRQDKNISAWKQQMAAQAGFEMLTGNFSGLSAATWQPLEQRIRDARGRIAKLQMEPHRRWANGFSCLCFVLVGAPLAVIRRNSDFLVNFFAIFLPILLVYYPLLIFSVDRAKSGGIPAISVWMGNVIMAACGIWLMRRVARY